MPIWGILNDRYLFREGFALLELKGDLNMNILNEVMTFAEATRVLGKHPSYLNDLRKAGKLKEGVHFRDCGGSRIILRSVVEGLRKGEVKMYKTLFEVQKITGEFKEKEVKTVEPGMVLDEENYEVEVISKHDTKDKAMEELKKYKSIARNMAMYVGRVIYVEEYCVAEVVYEVDEDGELDFYDSQGYDFAPISYEIGN